MNEWAEKSVKRSWIGGRTTNMALLPEHPATEEEREMAKKKCEHYFVYFDEDRKVLPANRKEMVCRGQRPKPDVYVAYRMPFCPMCGVGHADHPAKFEIKDD